mmetsp:Transcript_2397/g.3153  ORF Transcript_2397/g.3153 Transcript_2397/m.3153 type:complete len:213 (-) Transcript_2397:44-682(-)
MQNLSFESILFLTPFVPGVIWEKKRLERAIKQVQDKYDFQIKWKPFFLDPTLPAEGIDKLGHYKKKFGESRMAVMLPRMVDLGKEEGINFSYGGKIANTLNSHRLIHYAVKFNKQNEVVNTLFRNYFEEEKNIGSLDVLLSAAVQAGLDESKVKEYLESEEDKDFVKKEALHVIQEFGVSGVPFFVFNDKFTVSGAQDPAVFLSIFPKIAQQ